MERSTIIKGQQVPEAFYTKTEPAGHRQKITQKAFLNFQREDQLKSKTHLDVRFILLLTIFTHLEY